jgi:cytochrome c
MDSFEFNKIAGALLGTALAVFGLSTLSGIIYHAETPEKPGFVIAEAEAETGGGEAAGGEVKPIGALLASANAEKGASGAKTCLGCHAFEKGGANKTGPGLWDVVERGVGSSAGFGYSEALAGKASEKWTYDNLNAFLKDPKKWAPGTKMAVKISNDQKRADLIAYLASLSDSPKPFPAP